MVIKYRICKTLQSGNPLRANFIPLDIELNNQGNLPDLLLHPHNLRLVQKFLREWNRYWIGAVRDVSG